MFEEISIPECSNGYTAAAGSETWLDSTFQECGTRIHVKMRLSGSLPCPTTWNEFCLLHVVLDRTVSGGRRRWWRDRRRRKNVFTKDARSSFFEKGYDENGNGVFWWQQEGCRRDVEARCWVKKKRESKFLTTKAFDKLFTHNWEDGKRVVIAWSGAEFKWNEREMPFWFFFLPYYILISSPRRRQYIFSFIIFPWQNTFFIFLILWEWWKASTKRFRGASIQHKARRLTTTLLMAMRNWREKRECEYDEESRWEMKMNTFFLVPKHKFMWNGLVSGNLMFFAHFGDSLSKTVRRKKSQAHAPLTFFLCQFTRLHSFMVDWNSLWHAMKICIISC